MPILEVPSGPSRSARGPAPLPGLLTRPNTRPALLRISSRLSGFFFWGIRLLPVLGTEMLGLKGLSYPLSGLITRVKRRKVMLGGAELGQGKVQLYL